MSKVQLYVYDLSRGMAKSLSLALTGKQIDGIWHTSVVVFGREIFYGQGILEAKPGTTHHGAPMQIIDCGTTEIDPDTFQEYLTSLQDMYTPSAYHLIEFNCNHFSADVVGFLTGAEIPSWISGLPMEFLSTPFGQAMRPQIDAMFKRTAPSEHPVTGGNLPTPSASGTATPSSLASSMLGAVAAQATAPSASPLNPIASSSHANPTSANSPLTLVSSTANFNSILKTHSAVIANFTNTPSCAPCRTIKPVYESLAAECSTTYGARGARFVEIELGIGEGRELAMAHGVHATPTFIFFKDGKQVEELKGASKRELEARVGDFLEKCFPQHPHRKLYLPATEGISTAPITASQIPAYPALLNKLGGFSGADVPAVDRLRLEVVPFLEGKVQFSDDDLRGFVDKWTIITDTLLGGLEPEETFPVIDLWRVGLLNPRLSAILALRLSSQPTKPEPLDRILSLTTKTLIALTPTKTPKPFLLTVLRLLTNMTAPLPLANVILTPSPSSEIQLLQTNLVSILVDSLLHPDSGVRSAAGSLALNMAGWRHRVVKERAQQAKVSSPGAQEEDEVEVEWEVEVVSALLEGIGREEDEDVAHRLLAALALLIYLSPSYQSSLESLLQVLDAKGTLSRKAKGYKRKEVKKLAEEVANKLC